MINSKLEPVLIFIMTGYSSLAYNMNLSSGYSGSASTTGYSPYNQSSYSCLGYPTAGSFSSSASAYSQDPLSSYGGLTSGLTGTDSLSSLKPDSR